MGWLELLALLKRVLPLLDRLAPVLESAVAGRFSGRAEAERVASAAIMDTGRATSAAVAEVTRSLAQVWQALEEQRAEALRLRDEVHQLRSSEERHLRRVDELAMRLEAASLRTEMADRQHAALLKLVRAGLLAILVLLAIVIVLMAMLLQQHHA